LKLEILVKRRSRDRLQGIATSCRLDDGGTRVRSPKCTEIFSFWQPPDRMWCQPSLRFYLRV